MHVHKQCYGIRISKIDLLFKPSTLKKKESIKLHKNFFLVVACYCYFLLLIELHFLLFANKSTVLNYMGCFECVDLKYWLLKLDRKQYGQ